MKRNMLDIMWFWKRSAKKLNRNRKFVMYTKLHTQRILDNCRGCVTNNLSFISSKLWFFLLCNWYETFLTGWFNSYFLERKKKDHKKCSKNWWKFFSQGFISWSFSNYMIVWWWFTFIQSTHPSCCNSIKIVMHIHVNVNQFISLIIKYLKS